MLKIKWTDKVANVEVNESRKLMENIKKCNKRWVDHHNVNSLIRDALEGRMEGKRPMGQKEI